MLSFLFGSRGLRPDLPLPFGRKFLFCFEVVLTRFGSLPDREARLIKKEHCRCGPHPLQVTSSRARPPLVKGEGHIGRLFPKFRGWPLWFMASIALWAPHQLALEVVPGASLHSESLTTECGRECLETGDCGPTRHVGAGRWGLLG